MFFCVLNICILATNQFAGIKFIVSDFIQQFKYIINPSEMQSKKYVNNPEAPVFNIRKVNKKIGIAGKNNLDLHYFQVEGQQQRGLEFQNFSNVSKVLNTRKQKQMMLDQSVSQAIINSKVYQDLKKIHLQNKKKNAQHKKALEQQMQKKKQEKLESLQEKERLENQREKYIEAINMMKQKLEAIREANDRYREALNNRVSGEAEYISNLIMSMRFQAQYEHDIDPDQMTYQELLELQQKIGVVSKGLPSQLIHTLPKIEVKRLVQDQRCTVCFSNYQIGETMTKIFNCKHQFHFQCLQSWLGKEKVCPVCKQEVEFQSA